MNEMFRHMHSGLRWIALLALIVAIGSSLIALSKGGSFRKLIYTTPLYALHLQLVLGIVLLFTSPKVQFVSGFMKDPVLRFFGMEHVLMMLIGIVLVTIGHAKAKRQSDSKKQFKTILIYYTIGLIIILSRIPWPWQTYGAGWG